MTHPDKQPEYSASDFFLSVMRDDTDRLSSVYGSERQEPPKLTQEQVEGILAICEEWLQELE